MVAAINPQRIVGNWISGYALDVHTVASTYLGIDQFGHDRFDNKRSDVGELLYRMKYQGDASAASEIVEVAAEFVRRSRIRFDVIVPVPPSGSRRIQPVLLLANGIGEKLNLRVSDCVSTTGSATQLKSISDLEERQELLDGRYKVRRTETRGRSILLFDDVYRSGSTMNTITELLMHRGKAEAVRVLTITKTRSIQ